MLYPLPFDSFSLARKYSDINGTGVCDFGSSLLQSKPPSLLIGLTRAVIGPRYVIRRAPRLIDFANFSGLSPTLVGEIDWAFMVFRLTSEVGEFFNSAAYFFCSSSFCSCFSSIIFHF